MSSELQLQTELEEVRARLAVIEAKGIQRGRVRRRLLLLAGLGVISAGSVAYAQSECADGLFCFQPNTPARASEVNYNFAQLKQWLVDKVGPAETKDVTMSNATIGTATINNGKATMSSADVSALTAGTLMVAGEIGGSGNNTPSANGSGTWMGLGIQLPAGAADAEAIYPQQRSTWHEVSCSNGTFMCGLGVYDRNGSNHWDTLYRVKCCSL